MGLREELEDAAWLILLSYPKVFALIDHIDEKDDGVFSQHSPGTHDVAVKFIPHYFADELERRKTQYSRESGKNSHFMQIISEPPVNR